MKKYWFILLLSGIPFAQAEIFPEQTGHLSCKKQIQTVLESWKIKGTWARQVDPGPHIKAYRSPTETLGIWVELQASFDGSVQLYRISQSEILHMTWDRFQCQAKIALKPEKKAPPLGKEFFTDTDLQKLVETEKQGVIFVWSPGMIYSMLEYPEMKSAVDSLGLKIITVMDPFVEKKIIQKTASSRKLPMSERRLEAVELLSRNMTQHYPASIVFSQGKLANDTIIGALSAASFRQRIIEDLKSIESAEGQK